MLSSVSLPKYSLFFSKAQNDKPVIPPFLKSLQIKAAENTFENLIKNIVQKLEPNNYDQIMAAPAPSFEEVMGEVKKPGFDADIFNEIMFFSIFLISNSLKIPQKNLKDLSLIIDDHSDEEIEKAIKKVLPDLE